MGEEEEQDEVVAFLAGGGAGAEVRRITTHGAQIFIGRTRVLKMKRAVRFSFMDLSTLAKREAALRRELELNRRTAPQLYRDVVAVTREAGGGLELGGQGEPVEWLLCMNPFDGEQQLDKVAARGGLTPTILDALGAAIAAFHADAPVDRAAGGQAAMRAIVEGNESDLDGLPDGLLDEAMVADLCGATRAALEAGADLLDARRRDGLVRRVHGDLHLRNIALIDGRPVLFDCLEFSEELGTTDLLYDIAFLVMDLVARDLVDAARRVLDAWNDRMVDDAGMALLPLFIGVRATIRAKIAGFEAAEAENADEKKAEARRYLELARRVLESAPPRLVAIGGRSGTGKSSVAAALAPRLGMLPGAAVLRSDVVRKLVFGVEPTERLPADAYTSEVSERVYSRLLDRAEVLLQAGRAVILDAAYGTGADTKPLAELAARRGVSFDGLWLEAPEPVLKARVGARKGDASDADAGIVEQQRDYRRPDAWHSIDAGGDLEATVTAAAGALRL